MPVYSYKGVNAAGRNLRGFVDAESDKGARAKLRRDGVFLTELALSESGAGEVARGPSPSGPRFQRGVSGTDLAIATRQLATLLGAAVPMVEALGALTEQVENVRLKGAIGGVRDRVNEGSSLADALAAAGPFSDLYVNLVRAGEASGALDRVLVRLADYLESQVRTRNRVSGILIYPIIVLIFAVIVVAVLVTFVLPKVTELLVQSNQELPFVTSLIIDGSAFFRRYWWLFVLLAAAAAVVLRSIGRSERGRYALDGLKLRLPIFGRLLRTLAISRFSRTLTTLLSGGIPIVRSLDTAGRVTGNAVIAEAVERARESITEGSTIAAPLRASGQFPPLVTHMISVGERSGELEAMLAKVADAYDEQVEVTLSRLTAILQPVLMIVLVAIVAVIIVATLLPLLNLAGSLQQV
jgi:general secretion pathway protein F